MELILTALQEPLASAWERYCGDQDFVRVHRGSILDTPCDADVSPANKEGLKTEEDIEKLVVQICYRAADLAVLLENEKKELSDYSEELRRGHWND